jgi:hypothetical protein
MEEFQFYRLRGRRIFRTRTFTVFCRFGRSTIFTYPRDLRADDFGPRDLHFGNARLRLHRLTNFFFICSAIRLGAFRINLSGQEKGHNGKNKKATHSLEQIQKIELFGLGSNLGKAHFSFSAQGNQVFDRGWGEMRTRHLFNHTEKNSSTIRCICFSSVKLR